MSETVIKFVPNYTTVKMNVSTPGADGLGVPSGGATNTILSKSSGADNDTEWSTFAALFATWIDTLTEYDGDQSASDDGVPTGGWYVAANNHDSVKGGTLTQCRV